MILVAGETVGQEDGSLRLAGYLVMPCLNGGGQCEQFLTPKDLFSDSSA